MNTTIWKFPVSVDGGPLHVNMPSHARLLTVQMQEDVPTLWAEVDPSEEIEERVFAWGTTGNPLPAPLSPYGGRRYVGTVQVTWLVLHLYELTPEERF